MDGRDFHDDFNRERSHREFLTHHGRDIAGLLALASATADQHRVTAAYQAVVLGKRGAHGRWFEVLRRLA